MTIGTRGIVEFVFLVRGPSDSSIFKFDLLPSSSIFVGFILDRNGVAEKAIGDGSARHDCFTTILSALLRATVGTSSVPKREENVFEFKVNYKVSTLKISICLTSL